MRERHPLTYTTGNLISYSFGRYYQEDPTQFKKNQRKWEEADYFAQRAKQRSRSSWAHHEEYSHFKASVF